MSALTATLPRLYVSQEPGLGLFSAVEFGRVDDGQPSERWVGVGEHVGLLHDEPDGRCVGFVIKDAGSYDPDDPDHASLWEQPRFDVPTLGLSDVPPNAVFVAARALFGSGRTINRHLFSQAVAADGEEALELWMRCLQAGDSMAHFALGYTLFGLGRVPEAYRHLRHYTEIAPGDAWTWTWFGKAAAAMGELEEARAAYARAMEIDERRDEAPEGRTDADELLEQLEAGEIEVPTPTTPEAQESWLAPLERLMEAVPCDRQLIVDGHVAMALFDAEWVPVRLTYDGTTGAAQLQAQVGIALDGDGEMQQLFGDIGDDADDVLLDDGDVWLVLPVPVPLTELDVRTLEVLVRGASATAARLFDTITESQPSDDPPLGAPPTYEEVVEAES